MPPLSSDARRALLSLARLAIVETVVSGRLPEWNVPPGELADPGSAFVTVRHQARLRGCVGRTDRSLPLGEVVAQCAIAAVLRDPRFPPVLPREVNDLEIEISVLSEFLLTRPEELLPGLHGLFVVSGVHRGLLLPQVAVEHRWSAQQFLEETCTKAGISRNAWREPETSLYAFTAEIFSEADFHRGNSPLP